MSAKRSARPTRAPSRSTARLHEQPAAQLFATAMKNLVVRFDCALDSAEMGVVHAGETICVLERRPRVLEKWSNEQARGTYVPCARIARPSDAVGWGWVTVAVAGKEVLSFCEVPPTASVEQVLAADASMTNALSKHEAPPVRNVAANGKASASFKSPTNAPPTGSGGVKPSQPRAASPVQTRATAASKSPLGARAGGAEPPLQPSSELLAHAQELRTQANEVEAKAEGTKTRT